MIMIMADLKIDNNWINALRHIPRRKILEDNAYQRKPVENSNKLSAKKIKDNFRRNSVYNLLLKKS
jgi:ribonuclease P protein 1